MEEKHEKLVRWYLRFNGYLTTENYVIHEARMAEFLKAASSIRLG
jgi:hypothetical protein